MFSGYICSGCCGKSTRMSRSWVLFRDMRVSSFIHLAFFHMKNSWREKQKCSGIGCLYAVLLQWRGVAGGCMKLKVTWLFLILFNNRLLSFLLNQSNAKRIFLHMWSFAWLHGFRIFVVLWIYSRRRTDISVSPSGIYQVWLFQPLMHMLSSLNWLHRQYFPTMIWKYKGWDWLLWRWWVGFFRFEFYVQFHPLRFSFCNSQWLVWFHMVYYWWTQCVWRHLEQKFHSCDWLIQPPCSSFDSSINFLKSGWSFSLLSSLKLEILSGWLLNTAIYIAPLRLPFPFVVEECW